MRRSFLFICLLGFGVARAPAQTNNNPVIAPRAREVLRAACQYLAQMPYFSFSAEVWREHVEDSGEKLQFSREVTLDIKRPDRLHMAIRSGHSQRGFWFDGKALTILDRRQNVFSTASMPGTVDAMVDTARDEFGIDLPLIDLAVSDPYGDAIARVRRGTYYGLSMAMGYTCHHLAFVQDNIDWQVWIQDGPQPLIRKFVITHKNQPGAPEFTAYLRDWNLTDRISDFQFVFQPPSGALKIPMRADRQNGPANETNHPPTPTGRGSR